ncbi:MAG: glycosyltransferase family 4 protein [Segetibacter sp.]|nr:glycosyltransferase family 4 protein [Segetibacter sp.]
MRILHVSQNYFPSVGGPQYTMKHVSEKLVSYYGDEVQVCTTNSMYGPETRMFKKIEPPVETIEQVQINRLPFNRWHYPLIELAGKVHGKATGKPLPRAITKYRWELDSPAMDKMMAESKADVVMATTIIYNFSDYPFWRFRTKNPKPFVLYGAIHLHKPLPLNSPLIKRAKACDCYIANTDFEKHELIRYGVRENKIVTIGTGVELDDFVMPVEEVKCFRETNGIKETDVLIGFIGRLVKGKGVAILIDAFRKLYAENKNVKLLLAGGTTEYVPEIKRVIQEEKLPVILIESFDEKLKPTLYNSLDIFVLGSQSESFGVVFLEAWACKKPVVGSKMGAIQSLLSEGKDSLLFESGNADSLKATLQSLIDNREARIAFGSNGYKKVVENYTWEKIVGKYRDTYQLGIRNFENAFRKSRV